MFKNLNLWRYNLRSELLVFDQSKWVVNPYPTNSTVQKNIEFPYWKTLITETFGFNVWTQVSVIFTRLIKTTQEWQIFVQIWTTDMFLLTSQCFHFFHSTQPKDTPIEVSSVYSNTWPMTWIKENLSKYL